MKKDNFLDFVLEQMDAFGGVRARAMFGGHGLYQREVFFGIVHKRRLYFKTDEATRPRYAARGMEAFCPKPGMTLKTYFEVPEDVLESPRELAVWASEAVQVTRRK